MRTLIALLFIITVAVSHGNSQNAAVIYSLQDNTNESEAIIGKDHQILLKLYEAGIEEAIQDWYGMLDAIQQYAKKEAVDLNGVKLWMNVYFRPDGTIEAIGYHPKRGCKNMDWSLFEALLKEFSKHYQFPKQSDQPFSHYAAALWPVELLTGTSDE